MALKQILMPCRALRSVTHIGILSISKLVHKGILAVVWHCTPDMHADQMLGPRFRMYVYRPSQLLPDKHAGVLS